jgi:hypothetical protein
VVLTIPRLLRPLFRRRRDLLTELARAGAEATVELVRREAGQDVRPGLIISLATAGDLLQGTPISTCSPPTAASPRTAASSLCRKGTPHS